MVEFFVTFGANDRYEEGFPSRSKYTEDKVRQFNGTQELKLILESSVDPGGLMEAGTSSDDRIKPINSGQFLKK